MNQGNVTVGDYDDERAFESGERSGAEQLDLQHYLRILRKYKWPITLFTAAVTSLAAYYAYTATPVYSATSTLLIEQQKAAISLDELYGVDTENTDYYQTQFELLKSRSLAQRVLNRLDLWNHSEFAAAVAPGAAATGSNAGDSDAGVATGQSDDGIVDRISGFFESASEVGEMEEFATGETTTIDLGGESPAIVGGPEQGVARRALSSAAARDAASGEELTREQAVALGKFRSRLAISPVRNTKLVKIGFESTDPVLAAQIANTVGLEYITSYLDAKLEMTSKAQEWLNDRLATLKERLDESEDRLIAFKQENGLVDVGGVARLNEQQLLLLTAELAQARSELASTEDIYREVQALQDRPELLESIPAVQADPLVQRVKIEQGQAQRQLDELLNRYGERHPRVVDAKSQLATLDNTLLGHLRRVVGTVAKDYQLAQQRVASINANMASGKSDIQAIGAKKFELDALEREVGTNQSIYDQFFSRMTEANSADGLETANARVSDYARPPVAPIKPNKQLIIALAALGSLVISMLLAFLYETMDETVKSTQDIEKRLGLTLLGILPLVKGGLLGRARQELPLNPTEIPDKKGTFSEAVNTARTALCMTDDEDRRQVVMVTSSVPGEGKSTAAINLAYSLAQLERVLLIDCDMRRPTVGKAADLGKDEPGLGNLIVGSASARDCIKRGVFGGAVDILPSGAIPDQPLELLASRRFVRILDQLRDRYDRIVLDSAPTQAVSDALVLSKLCDAVIYVVKSHDTSIELVKRGVQRLQQVNAPIAGVLITQVDIDKITSYGGDYYYQGYYDYYGYTEKGGRKRPGNIRLSQEELISIRKDDNPVELDLDGFGSDRQAANRAQQASKGGYSSDARQPTSYARSADVDVGSATAASAPTRLRRSRLNDDLDIL